MGTAFVAMSMSLDGIIGGSDVDTERLLHEWFFAPSERNEEIIDELRDTMGAVVMGRRTYDEFETIDDYIETFPAEIQETLEELRRTIREAAPNAEETISYQIPTFEQEGIVVHFAGFDEHIGFYPTPSGMTAFEEELSTYEGGMGSVKLPLDEPIPFDLVREITEYRVRENVGKSG